MVTFEPTMYLPYFEILLMDGIISSKAIVLFIVQKITTGKMSLTLVHGTGNGGWHIQYRESGRAKYFRQASGFTAERCGWRVHFGLDLNIALWKLRLQPCLCSALDLGNHRAQEDTCRGSYITKICKKLIVTAMSIVNNFRLVNYKRVH